MQTSSGTMLIPRRDGTFEFHHNGEVHVISQQLAMQHFPELADAHMKAFGQKASSKAKTAGAFLFSSALLGGFCDELQKIAGLLPMPENSLSEIKTPSPKPASTNPLKKTISAYSQPKTLAPTSPSAGAQPTSGAPAVRT